MRKIWTGVLVGVLALAVLAGGAAFWYIKPAAGLTLENAPLNLQGKVMEMIQNGKAEVFLNESDVNGLVRASLAENPQITPELKLTGARVRLDGNQMTAAISGKYRGWLPFGATEVYTLQWRSPNLVLTPESLKIRSLELPETMIGSEIIIPVGEGLPPLVGIRSVEFRDHGAVVSLQLRL